ncbi:MAG: sugar phosphate isomerase/epimerase [Chthonomonadaceae bacterium]|nr:sugar phosphate isomerase/epimerase [Chthonomonadaceae bacterium]
MLSRRTLLQIAAATAAGIHPATARAQNRRSPYAPFRMGLQSYSLRAFKVEDALKITRELGLRYWESFEGHLPITDDPRTLATYRELLRAHNVTLAAFGVLGFSTDEADARRKFQFAKAMGIPTLTASPAPEALPLLDRLVEEYRVHIAIHNHGPEDRLYGRIQQGIDVLKGRHPRIGMCIDTGHYLRAGEDPLQAARAFQKRLFALHLKDVRLRPDAPPEFTEIGKGNLNTPALLALLRQQRYPGIIALEYEEHPENPAPYIQQCLDAVRDAIRKAQNLRPQP